MTVAACGAYDAELRPLVTHCLAVPTTTTARIQETHLLWGHVWAELVEATLGEE